MAWNDYGTVYTVDLMRQSRGWGAFGTSAPLDQFGYPTSLPNGPVSNLVSLNDHGREAYLPKGDYVFLWDGEGTFSINGGATLTGGRGVVNIQSANITAVMQSMNTGNPPRNIRLLMPGTEATYQTQPFFDLFLKRLRWCKVFRFMDWFGTNANALVSWNERLTLNHATQSLEKQRNDGGNVSNAAKGTCVELTAQLCNQLYNNGQGKLKTAWLCIPARADNDFVTQMATYFRDTLDDGLQIVLEYTNEPWNFAGAFKQGFDLDAIGRSVATGLPDWQYRLVGYAHRAPEVFKIWKDVWGNQASRVRTVANLQVNNPGVNEIITKYNHPTLGRSGDNFNCFATAPYFDGQGLNDVLTNGQPDYQKMRNVLNLTTEQVLSLMRTDAERSSSTKIINELTWIAENFPGKQLLIYECQQHITPDLWDESRDEFGNTVGNFESSARGKATAKFKAINEDPEMQTIMLNYYNELKTRLSGNEICGFTYNGPEFAGPLRANSFGFWGHFNGLGRSIDHQSNIKGKAAILASNENPQDYN